MQLGTFIDILFWIITGGIAGYLASVLLKAERSGCLTKIGIGIAGGFIGGIVMNNFLFPSGLVPGVPFLNQIINSVLGAVILLIVLEIVLPGKQLGADDDEGRRGRRRR